MFQMEVCVDNLASVAAAWEGGARRVELCSSLAEGGLTPTPGMAEAARALIEEKEEAKAKAEEGEAEEVGGGEGGMQIYALIRPRGGDFNYSPAEIKVRARGRGGGAHVHTDSPIFERSRRIGG